MAHWRAARQAGPDGTLAALVLCVLAAALLWLCAGLLAEAKAHSWYDGACCSGKDCFELSKNTGYGEVTVTRTGYNVVIRQLPPQMGGFVIQPPLQFHVVQTNTRPSQDEFSHACLYPASAGSPEESGQPFGLRCLYVPALGT